MTYYCNNCKREATPTCWKFHSALIKQRHTEECKRSQAWQQENTEGEVECICSEEFKRLVDSQ